jgi:uncharacterized protein YggU (UPF0235/DUF167 family)
MDDIRVKVIPKSSKTELAGYLVEFLAEHLGVAKSRIRIMSGETSQLKRIRVEE